MADLESGSTVGGFPIVHEGNLNSIIILGDTPDSMVSKTQADALYPRTYTTEHGITPKNGDILIGRGPSISIYNENKWNLLFQGNEESLIGTITGYLFRNEVEAEIFKNTNIPVDALEILNNWPRTSGNLYFDDPSTATGNAAQWYYDPNIGSFVQPINSATAEQILSPYKIANFEKEATLSSTSSDNDAIGLVVASDYIDGELLSIVAVVEPGGNSISGGSTGGTGDTFKLIFFDNTSDWNAFTTNGFMMGSNFIISKGGWASLGKVRVKVTKIDNEIRAMCTDWNGSEYLPETEIVFNINDLPRNGYKLKNSQRHGFFTNSQANSTYTNNVISSTEYSDVNNVFSFNTDKHWTYNEVDRVWELVGDASTYFDRYDTVINPLTMEVFIINDDLKLEFLVNNGISYGEVTFNLSGTSDTIAVNDITRRFSSPYTGNIYIDGVSQGTNADVFLSGGIITVNMTSSNGNFYVVLKQDIISSNPDDPESIIAYRKINFY